MKRPKVWSGRVNKWVFAGHAYVCPECKDVWGGFNCKHDHKELAGTNYDRNSETLKAKICVVCE